MHEKFATKFYILHGIYEMRADKIPLFIYPVIVFFYFFAYKSLAINFIIS